ncbi:hypothetical protein BJX68DRAFT_238623 [Aspergillus pseudodeflectus]|uniref:Uncharacterized protein n=1 Tax=Aspergillus pseudodeflectus TaxID=176178 RepID=A0ABR4K8W9_9EURO
MMRVFLNAITLASTSLYDAPLALAWPCFVYLGVLPTRRIFAWNYRAAQPRDEP